MMSLKIMYDESHAFCGILCPICGRQVFTSPVSMEIVTTLTEEITKLPGNLLFLPSSVVVVPRCARGRHGWNTFKKLSGKSIQAIHFILHMIDINAWKILTAMLVAFGQREVVKNLLCPHDKVRTIHPITTLWLYPTKVMLQYWWNFESVLLETFCANVPKHGASGCTPSVRIHDIRPLRILGVATHHFWPSDTIGRHRFGSTFTLTAPSHYLNQCWNFNEGVPHIILRPISQWVPEWLFCIMSLNVILLKILPHPPWANDLTGFITIVRTCTLRNICGGSFFSQSFWVLPSAPFTNIE